jgi:hypothetical protein
VIPGFLILHPFLGPYFTPVGNGAQHHRFPDRHGKVLDQAAREIIAFVASFVPFAPGAVPDAAFPAISERLFGQAPPAVDVLGVHVFVTGKPPFVDPDQAFLKSLVVLFGGIKDGANPAIQAAW